MRIAILVSGFFRSMRYNFHKNSELFKKYDVDYYLHLTTNSGMDRYLNFDYNIQEIIDLIKPIKLIIENEQEFVPGRNINFKRMWYKIYILNQLKKLHEETNNFQYDMVIRMRPDLMILEDTLKLESYVLGNDTIYGNQINDVYLDELNFGSSEAMDLYANLFLNFDQYNTQTIRRPEEFLSYHANTTGLKLVDSRISHKLTLSLCNIVGIAGDSGSGKSTLMNFLEFIFQGNLLKIEGDRYHKWERNHPKWEKYTHLNPEANHLDKFCDDVYNLKIGNDIYQVDYDHSTGKFTETQTLKNNKNIILCGLHTLFNENATRLIDFKIYLDPDENLRKYWKIKRDTQERGYDLNSVIESINKRKDDFRQFILPQRDNADLIIRFFSYDFDFMNTYHTPEIKLQLTIKSKYNLEEMFNSLDEHLVEYFVKYNEKENYIITFSAIQESFSTILENIRRLYYVNLTIRQDKICYYTIIRAFILYLLYFSIKED